MTIYRVFYTLCFANTFFKSKIAQASKSDGLLFYTDSESWDQTGLESELTSASSPLQFELLDFEMFLTLILPSSIERNLWLWNFQVFFSAFYIEYRKSSLNFVTFNAHFPNQLLISKLKCINTCIFFSNFLTKLFTFENFSFYLYFNYINDSWLLITCTSNIFLGNLARAKGQMLVLTSPFTYGARSRNVGRSILFITEFEERGVRKITTGITGLWVGQAS